MTCKWLKKCETQRDGKCTGDDMLCMEPPNTPKQPIPLLNCPFCGGKPEVVWDKKYDSWDCGGARTPDWDEWYVQCSSCLVVPNSWGTGGWVSEESAVKAWNRRVPII